MVALYNKDKFINDAFELDVYRNVEFTEKDIKSLLNVLNKYDSSFIATALLAYNL